MNTERLVPTISVSIYFYSTSYKLNHSRLPHNAIAFSSSQFVYLSRSDVEEGCVFTFETG